MLVDHFDKYPLITYKLVDYLLFKRAFELMFRKEHLTLEGLNQIVAIKASINKGLSSELKNAYPSITPASIPSIETSKVGDPHWFAGFSEAEGCFQVVIKKAASGRESVSLRFTLTQHLRDEALMNSLVSLLCCGRFLSSPGREEVYFIVSNLSDVCAKIIPLFSSYPLLGAKNQDYLDFVKVAELVKNKAHLTKEGLNQIKQIKSGMNKGR